MTPASSWEKAADRLRASSVWLTAAAGAAPSGRPPPPLSPSAEAHPSPVTTPHATDAGAVRGPRPHALAAQRRRSAAPAPGPAGTCKVSPYLYISPFFLLFAVVGPVPAALHASSRCTTGTCIGGQGDFVGLQNYVDVLDAAPLLDRAAQHLLHLPAVLGAAGHRRARHRRGPGRQPARQDLLAHGRAAALRGRPGRRRAHLLQAVRRPVRARSTPSSGTSGIDPMRWHADALASHVAIATMVNFRWTGYNTLILLAAMQAVPRDLYEAAVIDGAGRLRQFFSITVPHAAPDDDLRHHHLDDRRPADLRRAAHVRPARPGRRRPPVA